MTADNPLRQLNRLGQSVWLDFIQRSLLENGELQRMIDEVDLAGMTSNPAIFEQAIAKTNDYDDIIKQLAQQGKTAEQIYQHISLSDVQAAADIFRPVYERTQGRDGYVSLEVSPHLAHDTDGTIAEAHELWAALDRPNVMIKVPATLNGLPAIQQLISDGLNVNVTLLFSVARYHMVAEAYIAGLETRLAQHKPIDHIASVASFFISRTDTLVDSLLDKLDNVAELRGKTAVACARLAYHHYCDLLQGDRWQALAKAGAQSQRLLWASTGTKDPSYSPVKYVDELVGTETVNTMPPKTLEAYLEHGQPKVCLSDDLAYLQTLPEHLKTLHIDLEALSHQLETEGVDKFIQPFDQLMQTLEQQRSASCA